MTEERITWLKEQLKDAEFVHLGNWKDGDKWNVLYDLEELIEERTVAAAEARKEGVEDGEQEAEAELANIDAVLARREAIDSLSNRIDKILHAINEAKKVQPLEADNRRLQEQVRALKEETEKLKKLHETTLGAYREEQEWSHKLQQEMAQWTLRVLELEKAAKLALELCSFPVGAMKAKAALEQALQHKKEE